MRESISRLKLGIIHFSDTQDWKNYNDQRYSCQERLASLGVMGAQLRTPQTSRHYLLRGFRGALNWVLNISGDKDFFFSFKKSIQFFHSRKDLQQFYRWDFFQ